MKNRRIILFICIFFLSLSTPQYSQSDAASVRKLYEMGLQEQDRENYYRAIESYKTALQLSPAYIDPLRGLAESYFMLGEYREALKWCIDALRYDKNNLVLKTLQARIFIGLGQYDRAEELFQQVLQVEPYNFDAQFGYAELDIVRGRTLQAQIWYEKARNLQPSNRRAILSLALIYESRNQLGEAEELVKLALHYDPSNYMVQYLAGKHYFKRGDLARAEMHIKKALALKQSFPEATMLLSTIYLHKGSFAEVIATINGISDNKNNYLLQYTLGIAYEHTGDIEKSINSFSRVFRIRPDDEITRISLENLVLSQFDPDAPELSRYADYHFNKGKALEDRNYFQKALEEYRRGLQLSPFDVNGRRLYADIFKAFGYYKKYLSELLILKNEGAAANNIEDEIEIYTSLLDDEVSDAWGIRQYPGPLPSDGSNSTERLIDQTMNKFTVLLFYDTGKSLTEHPLSEKSIASYFYDNLDYEKKIDLPEPVNEYRGFSTSFQMARDSGSDFFLVFTYRENGRAFSGECDMYNGTTGSLLRSFRVFRTGNDKVKNALQKLSAYINEALPMRGMLVDKEFDMGLINLGRMDGIEPDMEFQIVQTEDVVVNPETLEFSYPDTSILGNFTVTAVDELVAEGNISSALFFDLINPGDTVLLLPPPPEENTGDQTTPQEVPAEAVNARQAGNLDLYREILKIR